MLIQCCEAWRNPTVPSKSRILYNLIFVVIKIIILLSFTVRQKSDQLGTSSSSDFTFELQMCLENYMDATCECFLIHTFSPASPKCCSQYSIFSTYDHSRVIIIYVHNTKFLTLTHGPVEEIFLNSLKPFTLTAGSDMISVKGSKIFLLSQ